MRALLLVLVALPLSAGAAAAQAQVQTFPNCALVTVDGPGPAYQNVCVMHAMGWRFEGDGYDYSYQESRLASTSEAHNFDVFETWGFDMVGQRSFRYYDSWGDGSSEYSGNATEVSSVRALRTDLTGTGYFVGLTQEEESYATCAEACYSSGWTRTTLGGSVYTSVRGGPGLGLGVYHQQDDVGQGCVESASVGADLLVTYEQVPLVQGAPCTAEAPWLRDALPFPAEWPELVPSTGG